MSTPAKQQIPKSHHYIPQMLLRRFTDEQGKLHFFSKQFSEKGVLPSTPTNLFREQHLYTSRDTGGQPSVRLERFYAALESAAEPVVEKIISAARNGELPTLTPEEREIWDHFHYNQWRRVPDFHNKFVEQLQDISDFLDEYEKSVRPLTDEERRNVSGGWRRRETLAPIGCRTLCGSSKGAVLDLLLDCCAGSSPMETVPINPV